MCMVSVSVNTTAANTAPHPPPTPTHVRSLPPPLPPPSHLFLVSTCLLPEPLLWVDKATKVVAQAWRGESEVVTRQASLKTRVAVGEKCRNAEHLANTHTSGEHAVVPRKVDVPP